MTDNLDIIALGESLIELSTNESLANTQIFNKYYGGDVLNTIISAARLGSKVGFITKVGNDYFKDFLINSWHEENIDLSQVKFVDTYNGLYLISKLPDGKKEIAYYRKKSAAATLSIDDISEETIEKSSIIYTTGITQFLSDSAKGAVKKAFSIANNKECLVAYDPNYREDLWSVDEAKEAMEEIIESVDIVLLSSSHDAEKLLDINSPDKIIKYFWDRGVPMVAVKMGESGCSIGYNGKINTIPRRNVEAVDSTGTGDAFNGGFLHGISKGYTPFEAAKLATVVAAEQSRKTGAIKAMPEKNQIYEKLNKGEG